MIRLAPDFREFLSLLGSAKIRYLLIGGYAVGFHGHPRPTGDLDVWVAVAPENAEKLASVLADFGFKTVAAAMFLARGKMLRFGLPPVRIEIATAISGVAFDACWQRRETGVLDGVRVNVISLADLLANKRAAARPKDLADIDALTAERTAAVRAGKARKGRLKHK